MVKGLGLGLSLQAGTNSPPEAALLCCGMLEAVGGGFPNFPEAEKAAKPRNKTNTKVCISRHPAKMMLLLLLVTFPLFCQFLTLDIRRQSEENNDQLKHSTAKKRGLDYGPLSLAGCCILSVLGIELETSPSQMQHLTTRVLTGHL